MEHFGRYYSVYFLQWSYKRLNLGLVLFNRNGNRKHSRFEVRFFISSWDSIGFSRPSRWCDFKSLNNRFNKSHDAGNIFIFFDISSVGIAVSASSLPDSSSGSRDSRLGKSESTIGLIIFPITFDNLFSDAISIIWRIKCSREDWLAFEVRIFSTIFWIFLNFRSSNEVSILKIHL